jgi:tetratricopeptide (TPR) repeat protein
MSSLGSVSQVDEALVSRLRENLASRQIGHGIDRLQSSASLLQVLDPQQPGACRFLGHLAQWVDVGFSTPADLKKILTRFETSARSDFSIRDYLYFRMAQGMIAMAEESADAAIVHFDFIAGLGEELSDPQSLAIVCFWKGRCLRKKGEYDEALTWTLRGRDLALELGHTRMAAVMRVVESWLLFQKGKAREAANILHDVQTILEPTDDYVTLGNIHSSYGRIARREGRYEKAVEHFARAIEEFRKRDPQHPNLARSLANMALAKRGIALQLRRKIDKAAERRRKIAPDGEMKRSSAAQDRQRLQQLREEALAHLDDANAIYLHHPNHHGVGTAHLNSGYIYLDCGDFDRAEAKAALAYQLGEEKRDYILMGRARVLECMIENARVDEEIGESTDPGAHARRAMEAIREAIELAKHTQNHRLLASAYLWQGLTHCNAFFDNPDAGRESYDLALTWNRSNHPDNMWEDLQLLKSKVLRRGSIDSTLKAWCQGAVGDKTFQQITEEFAEFIIPRVWEREGRKISRVAERLSISPKKVRRILMRAGRRKPERRESS